jgi:serine/threonine protein kinase
MEKPKYESIFSGLKCGQPAQRKKANIPDQAISIPKDGTHTCWLPPYAATHKKNPPSQKKTNPSIKLNEVSNRMLFYSPSVQLGLESESTISHFELKCFLGKGAFGQVLLAENKKTKIKYALKKIEKKKIQNLPKMCNQ